MKRANQLKTLISRMPIVLLLLVFVGMYFANIESVSSVVLTEGENTFIVDRTGERWDVTQALSLGFDPEGFEFGLGKNAFTPLDDSALSEDTANVSANTRVIGVADDSGAQAYTIGRLIGHEIANSRIGSEPIAVSF